MTFFEKGPTWSDQNKAILLHLSNHVFLTIEMKPFTFNVKETFEQFSTDPQKGLTSKEIKSRREKCGYNEFAKTEHTSLWMKFISQFKSFMIIVLLIAAVISGITGYMEGEGITR